MFALFIKAEITIKKFGWYSHIFGGEFGSDLDKILTLKIEILLAYYFLKLKLDFSFWFQKYTVHMEER